MLVIFLVLFILFITGNYCYREFYVASIPQNIKTNMKDSVIKITYSIKDRSLRNKIYYIIKRDNTTPKDTNEEKWTLANNNTISYNLDKNIYHVFLKNEDNKIFEVDGTDKYGTITSLEVNKSKIYLPIGGSYKSKVVYDGLGYIDNTITWTSNDPKIASVTEDGTIKRVSNGKTTVTAKIMDNIFLFIKSSILSLKQSLCYYFMF